MNIQSEMAIVDNKLKRIESILNRKTKASLNGTFRVGVDLGTSDIVVVVLDERGEPVAAFLEWAEVVRDGVVLDYWQASQIVTKLLASAEEKLDIHIEEVVTSFPPGTDPRISENVIKAAGKRVKFINDEPSSVTKQHNISEGAVVDIGGGTTGIAVVQNGEIVYSADEPTGGRHVTLTIAGNRKIPFEQAEELKLKGDSERLLGIVYPVFEKMADIINGYLNGFPVTNIYLSGGTCCFPGINRIFEEELKNANIVLPYNPMFLTPLAIASYDKG
jgi:ethanolamine utilization protein EutJ